MIEKKAERPKKADFVFVAGRDELDLKPFVSVRLMGKTVAAFALKEGKLLAREMSCKHQGADLTQGKLLGSEITCPRHGWRYDLRSGECLNHDSPPLREHEVAVEGEAVFVSVLPKQ